MSQVASVAVIAGSGLYSLFDPAESERRRVETPYGPTEVTIGELGGRRTAFLARPSPVLPSPAPSTPAC